jgi:hypothetical protein
LLYSLGNDQRATDTTHGVPRPCIYVKTRESPTGGDALFSFRLLA